MSSIETQSFPLTSIRCNLHSIHRCNQVRSQSYCYGYSPISNERSAAVSHHELFYSFRSIHTTFGSTSTVAINNLFRSKHCKKERKELESLKGKSTTMKFTVAVITVLLITDTNVSAFVSPTSRYGYSNTRLMDMPVPATTQTTTTSDLPVVQANPYGQPTDIRYSDFLKLVNNDRIEKVTFSADGTQLLGVDADGVRLKIEALPNDPDLLTQLTSHKVRCCSV